MPLTTASPLPKAKPGATSRPLEEKGAKIILNFDNADLYAVISTIAELLEINYIVDPRVTGKVTMKTAGGLQKRDLLPIFFQILEVNGLTAIQTGNLYKIVPLKDSPKGAIPFSDGRIPSPGEGTIIQLIPLEYISAQEMSKLITPFVSEGGTILAEPLSNTLLVVDRGVNILKILRLVETFDVNMFEKVHYRFYSVKYLGVEEVATVLGDFSASYGEISNAFIKFIPITRLNTLFVVSTTPLVFEKVEEILRQLDVVDKEAAPKIYVYFIRNGEAEDLANLLDKVFKKKASTEKDKKGESDGTFGIGGNPFSQSRMKEEKAEKIEAEKAATEAPAAAPEKGESAGTGTLMNEVTITPDEKRNALIITAIPSDYRLIEGILRQIDIMPRQVLIEATIAEITHTSSRELGMEWALGKGAASGMASFMATVGQQGLKYSIGVTDKWYAELNALASKGLVNVISSPHVMASDNQEAKIDVSREVPVASGQTTVASGSTISETTIEYRDTGVILSVTPHINDSGLVTMDIAEEVSDLDESIEVAGEFYPSFFKRNVTTRLTVGHGQTVVIGGLIKDKEEASTSGVPCLIDIPVVKYLAGLDKKSTEKIELIVLITPRVVDTLDEVDAATQEFKQKVRNVVKRFFPE
ncbi:MAG: type II secretion system secretin GspD [Deltaproteobacteria bacterium]|nr:type II secretion system secretin GspD [Deltaproteobacteria bacterium]